jgi:gamma-D-glutamyl-L-lysine dipeptidyl-peptidase
MSSASVSFMYVSKPHEYMRELPKDDSRVVSDAIYGEQVALAEPDVKVEEQKDADVKWVRIQTTSDGYKGWMKKDALMERATEYCQKLDGTIIKTYQLDVPVFHIPDTEFGEILSVPFGTKFKLISEMPEQNKRWIKIALLNDSIGYVQRGDVTINPELLSKKDLVAFSKRFLNCKYAFGGRSSFGYDCSGFCQMLYREMGIHIPRDSKDQIKSPLFKEVSLDNLQEGDLIFSGLSEDSIRHVAMSIGGKEFIHNTVKENFPRVHISSFDGEQWNGKGEWKFRAARRLIKFEEATVIFSRTT